MGKSYEEHVDEMEKALIDRCVTHLKDTFDAMRQHKPTDALVGSLRLVFGVQDGMLVAHKTSIKVSDMELSDWPDIVELMETVLQPTRDEQMVKVGDNIIKDTRQNTH